MNNDDELYNNLVTLLKLFKNRPYHLSKYLIENSALDTDFIEQILKSDKLQELQEKMSNDGGYELTPIYFPDISKMDEFYKSLSNISNSKDKKELSRELNLKMVDLLKAEKYEEAARLRDYMFDNRIKRNN
jgi:excinuclease UvrABC helicase subunit UvrB